MSRKSLIVKIDPDFFKDNPKLRKLGKELENIVRNRKRALKKGYHENCEAKSSGSVIRLSGGIFK